MRRRKSRNPRLRGPLQDRSRQTVEAIRQSAIQILERDGVRGLTTHAIAERAGVGIASLYRYFPNREAIIAEVIRSEILSDLGLLEESLALLNEADPDAWSRLRRLPLSERLRIHVDGVVRAHRALIERFGREFQARYYDLLREALEIPVEVPPAWPRRSSRIAWTSCGCRIHASPLRSWWPSRRRSFRCWSHLPRARSSRRKRWWTRCWVCCCVTSGWTESRRRGFQNPNSVSVRSPNYPQLFGAASKIGGTPSAAKWSADPVESDRVLAT